MNHAFTVQMSGGRVTGLDCRLSGAADVLNYVPADTARVIPDSDVIRSVRGSFTAADLEIYFRSEPPVTVPPTDTEAETRGEPDPSVPVFPMPEGTDLAFWITHPVAEGDFAAEDEKPEFVGGHQYYDPNYPVENREDLTGRSVVYTVTAYPDYADYQKNGPFVTAIEIRDPDVRIAGVRPAEGIYAYAEAFEAQGYTVLEIRPEADMIQDMIELEKDGIRMRFVLIRTPGMIPCVFLQVYVQNRNGIVF